jgi:uridylate kinase
MSAFNVGKFIDPFDLDHARELIRSKTVVIFAGGTGNPCFTTDLAAALRAVEIEADVMLKATQAPGVFDKDPNMYPDAKFFETIDVHEVIERRLGVLDAASVEILGRMRIPIIVLDLHVPGNIAAGLAGRRVGTLIVG